MPDPGSASLPQILEIKRDLSGQEKRFPCALIEGGERSAVLLYISTGTFNVHGLTLPVGTVTFGYYWEDRDYNVYHWQRPEGGTIAHYFNLADQTRISRERLEWRDLAVDILATPAGRLEVLDEEELPPDLDPAIAATIERARTTILRDHAAITAELDARSAALWGKVFG